MQYNGNMLYTKINNTDTEKQVETSKARYATPSMFFLFCILANLSVIAVM